MANPPNPQWPQQPGPPYGPPPPPAGGPAPGWGPGPPPPPPRRKGAGLVIALLSGGFVLALLAVAVVVLADKGGDDDGGGEARFTVGEIKGGALATPGADGSLTMARPGVTGPVVDVYEDFACPHCGAFDRMHDPMLKELAVAGRAKVVFRPVLIFGSSVEPAHSNSLRAAAALRCVTDGARWLSYQDALYSHQPASMTAKGYETGDLVAYGAPSGLTGDDFKECVTSQRHAKAVETVSKGYLAAGLQGTPSVRVNGRTLGTSDIGSADALRRAIDAAS